MNSSFSVYPRISLTSSSSRLLRASRMICLFAGLAIAGSVTGLFAAESTASRGLLLVANKSDQTMGIIDPVAGRQIAAVSEDGTTGHEVVASPDGKRAFVPIYGNSGVGRLGTDGSMIRVIDIAKKEIVATIDLGKGLRPHCPMIGPKNGLLYVTTELSETVTVIDPATLKILGTIPTGKPESHMLAISRDGKRGYTANVSTGTISVLDLETSKLITIIQVADKVQRIALTTDDKRAFTADQGKPRLAVIDTATNAVTGWIDLPGIGFSTAATPDGRSLIVTMTGLNKAAWIDLETMKITRTIDLPKIPQEVLIRPDGLVAYVSCDISHQVAAIDLKSWSVAQLIEAGPGADGLAWAATH